MLNVSNLIMMTMCGAICWICNRWILHQALINTCNLVSLFMVRIEIFGKFTHSCTNINTNSLQMLEYKLLRRDIDKVVNDEVNQFFKLSLNCHVILVSARMTCPIIIATPHTPATCTTIKLNNIGVIFVKILNVMLKFKGDIVCNMTSEITNEFNNRYCYPAPCLTLIQGINILKIMFSVLCDEYVFNNEITYGMFEYCFFFVFFLSL